MKRWAASMRILSMSLTGSAAELELAWKVGGDADLASKPIPGRPSKLKAACRRRLAKIVRTGPLKVGLTTVWWTRKRVAEIISREFDVLYHPDHVGRVLHALASRSRRRNSARRAQRSGHRAVANATLGRESKIAHSRGATVVFLDKRPSFSGP